MVSTCYQCMKPDQQLSTRSRCVACESARSMANESENEKLRVALVAASEAMARIRMVHDTAEGARAAWRIARTWQETHS